MSAYVIWLDQEHAKVFKFTPGKVDEHTVKRHHHDHHTGPAKHEGDHEPFYHDVAGAVKGASEILLVGPGLAKEHFKKHLEKHHHSDLLKSVVGTESMDHPTDNQITAHARKFFKARDLFTGV